MSNLAIEGLISGFKTTDLINSILDIQVRAPIKGIQTKVDSETQKLASWQSLNANVLGLDIASSSLSSTSLFKGKKATSSNSDIVSVSASSTAPKGNFSIKVNNLAKSDQISSDLFVSSADTLNYTGKFLVNGKSVSVTASDSMATIATKINSTNSGVKASIVQISPNQNKIVLSSTSTGVDRIDLREVGSSDLLKKIGLINNGPAQASYDYTVNADTLGALGDKFDLTKVFSTDGKQFSMMDAGGQNSLTVSFTGDLTLEQIRDRINQVSTAQGSNITAETVEDGGQYRLRLSSETGIPTDFKDPNNVLFDLGIANGVQSSEFSSSVLPVGQLLNLGTATSSTVQLSDGDGSNPISVDIDLSKDTLDKIKEKMDAAIGAEVGSDLSTQILTVNGRSRLEIKSASGQPVFNIATDTGNVFETLGLVDSGFKHYDQRGENSQFEFNGVNINRESNLVTDIVDGTSLALNQESSTTVNVAINEDYGNVSKALSDFVAAYNKVNDYITAQTYYKSDTKEKGLLFGDSTTRSLKDSLNSQMTQLIPDMPGASINELNDGAGVQPGKIKLTDRSGNSSVVDLTGVQTVQDVMDAINSNTSAKIKAVINDAGTSIDLVDSSGGYGAMQVSEVDGGTTAADLGFKGQIYNEHMNGGVIYRGGSSDLSEIGITVESGGNLAFDSSKLQKALDSDPDMVKNILAADNVGFSAKFRKNLSAYTAYSTGLMDIQTKSITDRIDQYNTQITRYNTRASTLEVTLRRQFSALEVAMSKSQQLGDIISSKLSTTS